MTSDFLMTAILSQHRFTSPTFFWGSYKYHHYIGPNGYLENNHYVVPCKYASEEEVMNELKKLYERICKLNADFKYPDFEDCVRYKYPYKQSIQRNVKGAYICMNPIGYVRDSKT